MTSNEAFDFIFSFISSIEYCIRGCVKCQPPESTNTSASWILFSVIFRLKHFYSESLIFAVMRLLVGFQGAAAPITHRRQHSVFHRNKDEIETMLLGMNITWPHWCIMLPVVTAIQKAFTTSALTHTHSESRLCTNLLMWVGKRGAPAALLPGHV